MTAGFWTASPPTCWPLKATAMSNGSRATTRITRPTRSAAWAWMPTSSTRSNTKGVRGPSAGAGATNSRRKRQALVGRLADAHRQVAQMRDQAANIAIVLAQEGDELVALLQGQPYPLIGHIHQHRLAVIDAHPEVHFRRLLIARRIDQLGTDDEVVGRTLGRAGHLQGLVGVFGEIGLILGGRVVLEGGNKSLDVVRRGAADILAQGEQRNAA